LHGEIERSRRLAAARDGNQNNVSLREIAVGNPVVVGQRVVDRLDPLLVIRTVGGPVRAADGVAGFDAQLCFKRSQKGFKVGQAEGIGLMDDAR
jgi:hypothetical protein